jgi:hypothetical protein
MTKKQAPNNIQGSKDKNQYEEREEDLDSVSEHGVGGREREIP